MTIERCCVCGEVKAVAGRTMNGIALCGECIDRMNGEHQ